MAHTSTAYPNYPATLLQKVNEGIHLCQTGNLTGSFLLVSVDNLAMIVNGYGHDVSESVMCALLEQIGSLLTAQDLIVRVQRDQFAVMLVGSYPEDTYRMAVRINTLMQNYGRDNFATAALHVLGTIGCVHFPCDSRDAEDVLDKAYIALHSMQESFFRTYVDTSQEADFCRQHMGLASYLYSAYKENRLRLAWQPVINTATGEVSHYEGLLRLINLDGKITSAGPLIPVAEKMGLIEEIDTMVMQWVVQELRSSPSVSIAFNVSNLTIGNQVWLNTLSQLIEETPEIGSRMIVEITETAAHRDLRRVAYFVASLQSMGCLVALDDFGSGYTSFRQLKSLSVDMVKIDGVFIKDLATNADNRFFVKTLLDFTRGFGLKSVAEFVETGETAKILMEMGVDAMQGYYFAKPENHRRWLQEGEYRSD